MRRSLSSKMDFQKRDLIKQISKPIGDVRLEARS